MFSRLWEMMQWPQNSCLYSHLKELSTISIVYAPFLLTNVGIMVVAACMCRPIIKFPQVAYIINPDFYLILAGYQPAWAMWYIALIPQPLVLCLISALGLVRIYQTKHSSLGYKYNICVCVVPILFFIKNMFFYS